MRTQVLVLAKAPVPGRVKTRLCPPCTPEQAAAVAYAAIEDTLDAVDATSARWRTLVADGVMTARPGWCLVPQRDGDLGVRIASAFTAAAEEAEATLLIGMDTPQVRPDLLDAAVRAADEADAALGLAEDGGWWALTLRDPAHATLIQEIPTSRPDTGRRTLAALRAYGLRVAELPVLRDVDTAADAVEVARRCPDGRFAAAVTECLG
ncbi:MAG: DUF2064 domain-containing protein [Hamadaea sp.]|uniref:TIGR04282 family arsenosugar biosynthesis glycosyltransferase n=1 Tax=Hamadaea sp. TaxID=2024425 RepID=UPI0018568B4E|nr:DUF2064 domain-containing protein [Hamadaea sp.]NUR70935.1 DUF2064 domain-containing protein [Hamadaea sp.]NUT21722.1 DUF2064 domain-containing protein [Hamadaea sp.]